MADHAWWLADEDPGTEGNTFQFRTYNSSNLIDAGKTGETGYGADIRCTLCKV